MKQHLWRGISSACIEGLTEFIPVSSTAHLLLAGHFLGFESPGNSFEVLIQLGAILAILSVYFARLWALAMALPTSAEGTAIRRCHSAGLPARGGDRRPGARIHQDGAVRIDGADLLGADRRRNHSADHRPDAAAGRNTPM
jgi:hypothetical protein